MASSRTIVVHLVSANMDSLMGAITVAMRMHEVAAERGVKVEVFIFAAAQRALMDEKKAEFNGGVDRLIAAGIPVSACTNFAIKLGAIDAFRARGITLEPARDAFIRYTLAGSQVITL